MVRIYKMALKASVASAFLAIGGQALAQDAAAPPANALPNADIIVTANKRSESLQRVPAAVSALSGDALEERGLTNIESIATALPNVAFGANIGTTFITIRGVGSTVESGIAEPTVALYVDGVFLPRATMALLRPTDLERLEVLRGPQGTLYGRNATGGAINFISKGPSSTFTAGGSISTGSRDAFGIDGYLSGPIAPGVKFRLSGGRDRQDGYVVIDGTGQRLGGTRATFVRGALQIEPTSNITIDLTARYERNTAPVPAQQLLTPAPYAPPTLQTTRPNHIVADSPYDSMFETFVGSGIVNWDISDAVSLKSITAYVDHKSRVGFDADATGVPFYAVPKGAFYRPSKSHSQEFNLVGTTENLKYIVGLYYFNEKAEVDLPVVLGSTGAAAFGLPNGAYLGPQSINTKQKSYAAFTDVTYSITDTLRINGGLRFNHDDQKFTQIFDISSNGVSLIGGPNIAQRAVKRSRFLPKLALQFDAAPRVLLYAQYSKGYKSGGGNLPGGGGEFFDTPETLYRPESINAYELGAKTKTSDGRITFNTAAFFYDYRDLQSTVTGFPATTLVVNADAKVYGLETELTWRPVPALTFNAAGTYLHARYESFSSLDFATGQQVNIKGKALPRSPDFTTNLGAAYEVRLNGEMFSSLTLRTDFFYTTKQALRYFGRAFDIQKGYENLDLSATFVMADEHLRLRGFVRNVTNNIHKIAISNFGTGQYDAVYAAPRTWGAELSFNF